MGMRFRKTVKICKGIKMNLSKSGASLSLGGRGHSINFGGRGTKATLGIPGTGLSYSTKVGGSNKSHSSSHRSSASHFISRSNSVTVPTSVQLKMSQDGGVEVLDDRGNVISDQSVVKRIKSTDAYKNMVKDLEVRRLEMLVQAYNESREENDKFIEIYKLSPHVDSKEQYIQILNSLQCPIYRKRQYDIPCPSEATVREQLKQEAKNTVQGSIFKVGKMRKEYVDSNIQSRLQTAISGWTQDKYVFEQQEAENEISETKRYAAEFNSNRMYLNNLINGADEEVSEAVESWISSCELPVEINIDYDWNQSTHVMYLDVDLPEIEDIPGNEVVRLANGNLKEKKKTQATLKQEYVNLVLGLAIFISANIFNASPAIHIIVMSGYTQRKNKEGEVNDEYVYSIKFIREIFENSILANVNPVDFCMRFENRSNITSTLNMKKIQPYEVNHILSIQ